MKNVVLASLLLLGVSDAFGVMRIQEETAAKGNVSITYKKVLKYKTNRLGLPYSITITNLSDKSIVVGPSIISAPLIAYQDIAKTFRKECKLGSIIAAGIAAPLFLIPHTSSWYKEKIHFGPNPVFAKLLRDFDEPSCLNWHIEALIPNLIGAASAFIAAYLLYKLATETQKILETKLAKEVLHAPITIQPGESAEKLFWLQNPRDQFSINFDTIKVLK